MQHFPIKHLRYQPHPFVRAKLLAIADHDPRALLAPVLQRIQAVVRQLRSVGVPVNAKNAAIVFRIMLHGFSNRQRLDSFIMPQLESPLKQPFLRETNSFLPKGGTANIR